MRECEERHRRKWLIDVLKPSVLAAVLSSQPFRMMCVAGAHFSQMANESFLAAV
jgi:hypothetical protein